MKTTNLILSMALFTLFSCQQQPKFSKPPLADVKPVSEKYFGKVGAFEGIRVFTWGARRKHYETSFIDSGLRGIASHAKGEEARAFYSKFGFEPSPVHGFHLYLLMKDIKKILAGES